MHPLFHWTMIAGGRVRVTVLHHKLEKRKVCWWFRNPVRKPAGMYRTSTSYQEFFHQQISMYLLPWCFFVNPTMEITDLRSTSTSQFFQVFDVDKRTWYAPVESRHRIHVCYIFTYIYHNQPNVGKYLYIYRSYMDLMGYWYQSIKHGE